MGEPVGLLTLFNVSLTEMNTLKRFTPFRYRIYKTDSFRSSVLLKDNLRPSNIHKHGAGQNLFLAINVTLHNYKFEKYVNATT